MKIAIFGKMASGKSTLSKYIQYYLANNYDINLKKVSFADKIYEIAYDLFGMKEKDRKLLQDIGQKMREIDENIFTIYTIEKCVDKDVIIEDCRLLSEFNELKKNDFIKIRIKISNELQLERLKRCYPSTYEEHLKNLNHRSEIELESLNDDEFDLVINAEDGDKIYQVIKEFFDNKLI